MSLIGAVLFDGASDPMVAFSVPMTGAGEATVAFANRSMTDLLQAEQPKLANVPFHKLFSELTFETLFRKSNGFREHGSVHFDHLELSIGAELVLFGGQLRPISTSETERLLLLTLQAASNPVADHSLQQELLAQAHTLMWQATAELIDGALVWNLTTNDEESAARWMPISRRPGEPFGTAWGRARNPSDHVHARAYAFEAITTGRDGYSQTFRIHLVDGSIRWIGEDVRIRRVSHTLFELVGVCTDVTEKKLLELEQFQRDQRLGLHALQSGIGFVEWASDLVIASSNKAFEEMFAGLEIYERSIVDIVAESNPDARQTFLELIQTGETRETTLEHHTSDGQTFICEWKISPMTDLDGSVIGQMALVQNVTVRVRAERLLRLESNLLNTLMDNIPDSVYIKDEQSRFLRVSRRMAHDTLGLDSPAEAVGKTDFDFFTKEHAQPAYDDELQIIATGKPILNKVEKETHSDGKVTWVHSTKAPVFDADSKIVGTVGISRDITEQVNYEEQRRRAESEAVTVMASANCLVWRAEVTDDGGELKWDVELSNTEAALRCFPIQYDTDAPFALNWISAIHPDDFQQNVSAGIEAIRSGAANYRQEFRIRLADGSIRWVAENVSIDQSSDSGKYRVVGVCIDITDNKNSAVELSHLVHSARCVLWHASVQLIDNEWHWQIEFSDPETVLSWLPIPFDETDHFGTSWSAAILPTDRAEMDENANQALSCNAIGYEHEFRMGLADGRVVWIAESVYIEHLEPGHKRLVGVCMDVTKRKQAEADQRHIITNLQCLVWHGTIELVDEEPVCKIEIVNEDATRRWLTLERTPGWSLQDEWVRARPLEDSIEANRTCIAALTSGANSYSQEFRSILADGSYLWLSEEVQLEPISENKWNAVGVCSDVTAYKEAQQRLAHERNLLRTLIDNLPDAIFAKDIHGKFTLVNTAEAAILNAADHESCINKSDEDFYPTAVASKYRVDEIAVMETGTPILNLEEPTTNALGETTWISTSKVAVKDDQGVVTGLVGVSRDITERKNVERDREKILAEALERADRDPLTGLLNHRAFHKRLEEEAERAVRQGTPLAIAVLDLDNFKFFNDAYGHSVGDEVLCQLARSLRSSCRTYDILARFGGDEFALLMPGTGPVEAHMMEERLRFGLDGAGYIPPGHNVSIPLSVSIGISVYPIDATNRLDALAIADERLIRSKTGGSERAEQSEQVRSVLSDSAPQFSMLNALVAAVDNKDRYTRRHSDDVLEYSLQIAKILGMNEEACHVVQVASLLHDVGKIGVPDYILRKPGKLSEDEYAAIRQHPTMGAVIVGAVPGFERTLEAVRYHHERWDGKGYPEGLRGSNIPIIARLMAVADAYSAMTTDRPYRKGLSTAIALSRLVAGAGTQWDAECVDALLKARAAFNEFPAAPLDFPS